MSENLTMQDIQDCYDEIMEFGTYLDPDQAWEELAKARKKFMQNRDRALLREFCHRIGVVTMVVQGGTLKPDPLPDDEYHGIYDFIDEFLREQESE